MFIMTWFKRKFSWIFSDADFGSLLFALSAFKNESLAVQFPSNVLSSDILLATFA